MERAAVISSLRIDVRVLPQEQSDELPRDHNPTPPGARCRTHLLRVDVRVLLQEQPDDCLVTTSRSALP